MKTTITQKLLTVLWLLLIYVSFLGIISNNSWSWVYKNQNLVHRVSADINFYLDRMRNESHNTNWTSPSYPLETIYEEAIVTVTSNPAPEPVTIAVSNVTRHSH